MTNSGSIVAPKSTIRVTRTSRIWVKGRHGVELAQHVWGGDFAKTGIVVQLLEGVDKLEEVLEAFGLSDRVCADVPVDHLVPGSKELRIAEAVTRCWREGVLVLDHPHVDIWQTTEPSRFSLETRLQTERGIDIKHGTPEVLGWPHKDQVDVVIDWKRILSGVRNHKDPEPAFLGRAEELIDFVTVPGLS